MVSGDAKPLISAVIVAAGLSSRMGAFKPMLPLGDSTIIRWCVRSFQCVGVGDIVVVTGRDADRLAEHLAPLDVRCVLNENYASTDMFYSVQLGLRAVKRETAAIFFTPGDVPLFAPGSLFAMLEHQRQSGCGSVIPSFAGERGHPVLIHATAIADLLRYSGEDGLRGALSQPSLRTSILAVDDRGILLDADTPADYEQLQCYSRNMQNVQNGDVPFS